MARLNGGGDAGLTLAAALVSSAVGQGNICLDLRTARKEIEANLTGPAALPSVEEWFETLRRSRVVGAPGEYRPLVLDDKGRLYLYRYWEYQEKLAKGLRARMESASIPWDPSTLRGLLDRLFPSGGGGGEIDWQKVAALASVRQGFCVVSGGPGTGKTTTVAKVLALLLELAPSRRLRMALAAPTGKAAARLQEAIKDAKAKLDCAEEVKTAIPEAASTIHRLLGSTRGTPYFRHNEENRLPVDVLVVDEASMVDLPLMSKLVQALPPRARLILLGDRDQLSSVEAGAVLGDICATGGKIVFSKQFADECAGACGTSLNDELIAGGPHDRARDCIVELRKSYRFSGESGIALFSARVRAKDPDAAVGVLREERHVDLVWTELSSCAQLGKTIRGQLIEGFRSTLEAVGRLSDQDGEAPSKKLGKIFKSFASFRVLCAVREGPCGVTGLNLLTENILHAEGLIERGRRWYTGRPVLIQRNDTSLHLFNGDIGIYLPDLLTGSGHRVFFPGPEETFRGFHPQRLPEHQTVWAMTVHKSQGSEFDEILLVLPDRESPVLSRELIYTAVTRAREKATLLGPEPVLRQAILRSTERLSGLSDALWDR
jgi:exodeoxyribonuclease V alpha subunit